MLLPPTSVLRCIQCVTSLNSAVQSKEEDARLERIKEELEGRDKALAAQIGEHTLACCHPSFVTGNQMVAHIPTSAMNLGPVMHSALIPTPGPSELQRALRVRAQPQHGFLALSQSVTFCNFR